MKASKADKLWTAYVLLCDKRETERSRKLEAFRAKLNIALNKKYGERLAQACEKYWEAV